MKYDGQMSKQLWYLLNYQIISRTADAGYFLNASQLYYHVS